MRYAIIGCGLIGRKRALALPAGQVAAVWDPDALRRELLARDAGAVSAGSAEEAIQRKDVDAVIVATPNNGLAPVALLALQAGKHVLVEKPGAVSVAELEALQQESARVGSCLRFGYNHRFHAGIAQAKELATGPGCGPLMMIRARYGHGGRVGYEKEWRANPAISGGGELIDQGVHLLDLARWLMGDFVKVEGKVTTLFWDMPVEDNAFMLLENRHGAVAWLHASCTEWKNMFSLEIYGKTAKIVVEGLGGSYGTERLTYHQMKPEMGPPETQTWEFPGADESWRREMEAFAEDAVDGKSRVADGSDALAVLRVVEKLYAGGIRREK